MRLIIVIGLIGVQLLASLFYASAALAMWGPFMTSPATSKLLVGAIVIAPLLGFLAAYERIRLGKLGSVAAVGLITTLQIVLVLIFVMTSGGQ